MALKREQRQEPIDRTNIRKLDIVPAPAIELSYDYDQVAEEHRATVRAAAVEIKRNGIRLAENLIAIGKQLIQVKEVLEYGQFGEWIETEFHWAERTAQQLMNAARVYGEEPQRVADLNFTISTIYLLAAPSTPEPARRQIEEIARSTGKPPTRQRAKQIVDAHKPPSPAALATPALPVPPPLTLDQTMAWLWTHIKCHCITQDAEERLAWLQTRRSELNKLPGADRVQTVNLHEAAGRVEKELQGQIDHAQRTEARREMSQPKQDPQPAPPTDKRVRVAAWITRLTALKRDLPEIPELTGLHVEVNQLRRHVETVLQSLEGNR